MLPCGGEVAGDEAKKAEEDGCGGIDVNAEIGCEAAALHGERAPVSGGKRCGLREKSSLWTVRTDSGKRKLVG
jgi:hypothetical protein